MILVERGIAVSLGDAEWLDFLNQVVAGDKPSAENFGCPLADDVYDFSVLVGHDEILDAVGDFGTGDPFADVIVVEQGMAWSVGADAWPDFLTLRLTGNVGAIAGFGLPLGPCLDTTTLPSANVAAAILGAFSGPSLAVVGAVAVAAPVEAAPELENTTRLAKVA